MHRLMHIALAAALAASGSLVASSVAAQAPPAATIAKADVRDLVARMQQIVDQHYLLPARRAGIHRALANGLKSGRYDVADANTLATRLNEDLLAASNDHHLNVQFNPEQAARVGEHQGDDVHQGPEWERDAQLRNHGIITMRMIPGNIRYIAYDNFVWTGPRSAAAIDTAMAFLREGDAAILDLRFNGGGSPLAVQYLTSYFVAPGRPLTAFELQGQAEQSRTESLATLGGERMVGKPLYVIIGPDTASAAEAFAGEIGGLRAGELVGAKTFGAAYRNDLFGVGHGFVFSVSVGRPILAATGGDWEGKGISPTIAVDPDLAQDVAIAHALRKIAATAPAAQKAEYLARADTLWARGFPYSEPQPLAAYAGTFGERTVTLQNGKLIYERRGGLRSALVPVGPNRFGLDEDPSTHVLFALDGAKATGFELVRADGSRTAVPRTT